MRRCTTLKKLSAIELNPALYTINEVPLHPIYLPGNFLSLAVTNTEFSGSFLPAYTPPRTVHTVNRFRRISYASLYSVVTVW